MNLLEAFEKLNSFSNPDRLARDDYSRLERQDREENGGYKEKTVIPLSVSLLGHYIGHTGKNINLSERRLRAFKTVSDAEKENQNRLVQSLTTSHKLFKN